MLESSDLQAEYGMKTNIWSLGWRSKDPGGLVMTYRAVEASELSVRSRYLYRPIQSIPWYLKAAMKRSSYLPSDNFSSGVPKHNNLTRSPHRFSPYLAN